jgi:phosphate transport system substrate-binding protein
MQQEVYDGRDYEPEEHEFAKDGVVAIVHPKRQDTLLTLEQLRSLLSGEARTWQALRKEKNTAGQDSIIAVFDHSNSSTRRFLSDSLLKDKELSTEVAFAAGSHPKVIDYVANHKNAIGFMGLNWLSDKDDPAVQKRLKQIKTVELPDQKRPGRFLQPMDGRLPVYLRDSRYPLTRTVHFIKKETHRGLGTGFERYVVGTKGARITAKMGLFPAQPMSRQIQIKEGPVPNQ